jgi:uncharacterized membrane protein YecN with MAPEG domain
MFLPITLTFAAAAALLNVWLAMRLCRLRMSENILNGDAGNTVLMKRMRAQSNFVEYTPFILILTGLIEMAWDSPSWLWVLALIYIVARIAHVFGMESDTPSKGRIFGFVVTFITLLTLSGAAIYTVYTGMAEGTPQEAVNTTV